MEYGDYFKGTNLKIDYGLNWNFNQRKRGLEGSDSGIGYLLYSAVLPGKEREYVMDRFKFSIKNSRGHVLTFDIILFFDVFIASRQKF
jgi:hypothetical protein